MELPPRIRTVSYYKGVPIDLHAPICTSLPRSIILPLCIELSHEQAVMTDYGGGDWHDMAAFIGLPVDLIRSIDEYRGDKTKAFTLLDLWDRGIPGNPGTLMKLIIALEKGGFNACLQDFIINKLEDCFDFPAIKDYIRSLTAEDIRCMFPVLEITDVHWDERLESTVISDVLEDCHDQIDQPLDTRNSSKMCTSYSHIVKDSIFISHFSGSRVRSYKREVENLIKTFRHRKHTVWCGSTLEGRQREACIRSAQTIMVVYNEEYHHAHLNFLHGHRISSSLSIDIPLLSHIFYNGGSARNRIIPVMIDKVQAPPISDLPVWLTGVPRLLYPSQKKALVHTVQGVPEFFLPSPKVIEVRRIVPKTINKDDVIRQFQSRRM